MKVNKITPVAAIAIQELEIDGQIKLCPAASLLPTKNDDFFNMEAGIIGEIASEFAVCLLSAILEKIPEEKRKEAAESFKKSINETIVDNWEQSILIHKTKSLTEP